MIYPIGSLVRICFLDGRVTKGHSTQPRTDPRGRARPGARGEPLALNAVARAAGVGVGTVYRHFAAVQELEETLVWERFDDLDKILQTTGPAQLERALIAHFTLLTQNALFEKVIARPAPALEQTAVKRDALIQRLSGLIERAQGREETRPDIDASAVLLLLCGLAHAARSAQVAPDSPLGQVLLGVLIDGLHSPQAS